MALRHHVPGCSARKATQSSPVHACFGVCSAAALFAAEFHQWTPFAGLANTVADCRMVDINIYPLRAIQPDPDPGSASKPDVNPNSDPALLPDLSTAPPAEHFSQSAFHSLPHYSMPGAFRNDLLLPSTQATLHRSCIVMKV